MTVKITFVDIPTVNQILRFKYYPNFSATTPFTNSQTFVTTRAFPGQTTIKSTIELQAAEYANNFILDSAPGQFTINQTGAVVIISALVSSEIFDIEITGATVFATWEIVQDIEFVKDLPTDKLLMAYNNQTLIFNSTYAAALPKKATVTVNGFALDLYPRPNMTFYCNLKTYLEALVNTRKFFDTLQTDLIEGDADSFIYDYSNGMYLEANVNISIEHQDDTIFSVSRLLKVLAGVDQLQDYKRNEIPDTTECFVMQPVTDLSGNQFYAKYWRGYPFDISIYSKQNDIEIVNTQTLIDSTFTRKGFVNRLFFSDGENEINVSDVLSFAEGTNRLTVNDTNFLTLEVDNEGCEGIYLKWLNKYGGYTYWLFNKQYEIQRSTKDVGELFNDYNDLADTISPYTQIGKESQDEIKIATDAVTKQQNNLLSGLLRSPKVLMFTGTRYSKANFNDWIEVNLKPGRTRIKEAKIDLINYELTIELPKDYTQKL